MSPAAWRRVEELCEAALPLSPGRRAAYLDRACAGDSALRREIESLLACEGRAARFPRRPHLPFCFSRFATYKSYSPTRNPRLAPLRPADAIHYCFRFSRAATYRSSGP